MECHLVFLSTKKIANLSDILLHNKQIFSNIFLFNDVRKIYLQ